jgi:hypothetical protein
MLANAGTLASISERYGIRSMALSRHRTNHLKSGAKAADERITKIALACESDAPQTALQAVDQLQAETWRLLNAMRAADVPAGQVRTELQAIREIREGIALRARLTGELGERGPGTRPEPEVAGMSDKALVEEYERTKEGAPKGATVN